MRKISTKIGVTALSLIITFGSLAGTAAAPGGGPPPGPPPGGGGDEVTVDCGLGQSLQEVINEASAGSTLFISGTCNTGPFAISKNLKLRGPATLSGGDVVLRVNHHSVEITNLNIDAAGVSAGILVSGAELTLNHVVVENATGTGINLFQSSSASICCGSVVSNNGGNGIAITLASGANVSNTTIQNNGNTGIVVSMSSSATIQNSVIDGNRLGIEVNNNSAIFHVFNTITGNTEVGLIVLRHGYVQGAGDPSTFGNNGVDVRCIQGGILAFFSGPQLPTAGTSDGDGTCLIFDPIF